MSAILNPIKEPCWTRLDPRATAEVNRRTVNGYECRVWLAEKGGTWSFTLRGRGRRPVMVVRNGYPHRTSAKDAAWHCANKLPRCGDVP